MLGADHDLRRVNPPHLFHGRFEPVGGVWLGGGGVRRVSFVCTQGPMTMSSMTMVVMAGAMAVTVNYQLMQMVMQNTTVTNTAPKPGKRHEKEQTRQGAEWGRTPA